MLLQYVFIFSSVQVSLIETGPSYSSYGSPLGVTGTCTCTCTPIDAHLIRETLKNIPMRITLHLYGMYVCHTHVCAMRVRVTT